MSTIAADRAAEGPGLLDRLLGLFSEVHAGEGGRTLLMLANIFLILVSYYVIKTVREPLILNTKIPGFSSALGLRGPAEVKAYAAAGQALLLMAFVPAYSWFASRVDRMKLIVGVTLFFVANILVFAFSVDAGVPFIGDRVLRLGGHLQPLDHRAVLVLRERHLHEGGGQPALSRSSASA